MSIPIAPLARTRIALRQGLFFGAIVATLAILIMVSIAVLARLHPVFVVGHGIVAIGLQLCEFLGLATFFFAGWRASKKTAKVEMGALAGFWAGIVAVLAEIVIHLIVETMISFRPSYTSATVVAAQVSLALLVVLRNSFLALILGAGLGLLGGFVGEAIANGSTTPVQPAQLPTTQPAPPDPTRQNSP